jgi:hypothetical protein
MPHSQPDVSMYLRLLALSGSKPSRFGPCCGTAEAVPYPKSLRSFALLGRAVPLTYCDL